MIHQKKRSLLTYGGLTIALFGVAFSLTGCKGKVNDTPEHLEIKMYKAGNGTESVKNVAARFMELNPGKTVDVIENTEGRVVESEFPNGPKFNTVDLYLAGGSFFNMSNKGAISIDGVTYENSFASLDDVYENPAYGETVAIKDKMLKSYSDYYYGEEKANGKHSYFAPWVGGWRGIVYNSKMFEQYHWNIPRTTDEMFELCETINATKAKSTNKNTMGQDLRISPFTYSRADSYWDSVETEWWIQYEGIENYKLFGQGMNANHEYSPDVVAAPGILESMRVMEKILGTYYKDASGVHPRSNIYCDNTLTFRTYTDIQSTFLYGEEARLNPSGASTAAMMPVGDWLENEMSSNFAQEIADKKVAFRTMKTPIVSALANKTSFKGASDKDLKLREIVSYIDNEKKGDKPSFATDEDIRLVDAARHVTTSQYAEVMMIPTYSSSVELAKDFIRFLYSDEALRIFLQATKGVEMPLTCNYDGIEISDFQKSKFEILNRDNVDIVLGISKYPMAYAGILSAFTNSEAYGTMESKFGVANPADFMSAEEIFQLNYNVVAKNWQQKLRDAGILN